MAPLVLRAMVDAHITLAWVLRDPKDRARKYILYGLGQEKLYIEHLKAAQTAGQDSDEPVAKLIEVRETWLNGQRRDFLTEVNLRSWSGISTREMAQEADCLGLYNHAYLPFSGVVHSMWQHVAVYNLRTCGNPLHKFHRVPHIADVPLDPDYVYRSAKYVSRSFELFDVTYQVQCETPAPVDWFVDEMGQLFPGGGEARDDEALGSAESSPDTAV